MVLQHQVSGPGGSLKIANKSIVTVKRKKGADDKINVCKASKHASFTQYHIATLNNKRLSSSSSLEQEINLCQPLNRKKKKKKKKKNTVC